MLSDVCCLRYVLYSICTPHRFETRERSILHLLTFTCAEQRVDRQPFDEWFCGIGLLLARWQTALLVRRYECNTLLVYSYCDTLIGQFTLHIYIPH